MSVEDNELNRRNVVQSDHTKLNVTTIPNATYGQPVIQVGAARGIWPGLGATRLYGGHYVNGIGTVELYVVGVGEMLFISGVNLTSRNSDPGTARADLYVTTPLDVIIHHVMTHYHYQALAFSDSMYYCPAIIINAGFKLVLESTATGIYCRANWFGWLEDE